MKDEFEDASSLENLPPVNFYHGDVVEIDGTLKIEWLERPNKPCFYDENCLAMRERSARDMLINRHKSVEPVWTREVHIKWRDLHYNIEYALEKLQKAKMERGIELDTAFHPDVPNP